MHTGICTANAMVRLGWCVRGQRIIICHIGHTGGMAHCGHYYHCNWHWQSEFGAHPIHASRPQITVLTGPHCRAVPLCMVKTDALYMCHDVGRAR